MRLISTLLTLEPLFRWILWHVTLRPRLPDCGTEYRAYLAELSVMHRYDHDEAALW
jgi:hypothetical protein